MAIRQSRPCVHHRVLSDPNVNTIQAVCRRCEAQRTYPSVLELDYRQAIPNYDELDQEAVAVALSPAPAEEDPRA